MLKPNKTLTVGELINELENFDSDTPVLLMGDSSHYQWRLREIDSGSDGEGDEVVIIREGSQLREDDHIIEEEDEEDEVTE